MGRVWVVHLSSLPGSLCTLVLGDSKTLGKYHGSYLKVAGVNFSKLGVIRFFYQTRKAVQVQPHRWWTNATVST